MESDQPPTSHPPLSQQPMLSKTPLILQKTPSASPPAAASSSPARPLPHEPQSRKLFVDEANTDKLTTVTTKINQMVHLLAHASDDDKTLVLFELQQVLQFARDFVLHNILPVLCAHAASWSEAVQTPAAEALAKILASSIPTHLAKRVSRVACDVIRSATDESNRQLWSDVLVRALPYGAWSAAELDRLVQLLHSSGDNLHVTSKLTARILGSMAVSSVDHDTKKVLLRRAISMAQVDEEEVRGIVADSMAHIGAALDIKDVEQDMWSTLELLVQDDSARVHAACLRTVSHIVDAHRSKNPTSNLFRTLILPLFHRECVMLRRAAAQDARTMDEDDFLIVEINSEVFGSLLLSCSEYIVDDVSRKDIFKAFQSMSACNSPVIRKNCANNFAHVAQCLQDKFCMPLVEIIDFLSQDADDETRWTLACRLHESLKHLANRDSISHLFRAVLTLLRDKNFLVRQNLMQRFQSVIADLSKYCTYNSSGKMTSLFEQLPLLCDDTWRVQELLVKQLQLAAPLVPPSSMTGNVLPLLYHISREGTFQVRRTAMGCISVSIRFIPDAIDRERVMRGFCQEWARGKIYWMRTGFIEAAKIALGFYSRCLFRDTFGLELLRLAYDSVSNVRLKLVMLLPAAAPACYQIEEFQSAVEALKKDPVPDIRELSDKLEENIDKSLEEGRERFEDDMKLEEEERELYSRHLQNQKEANKKNKNLKKAAGAWWTKGGKGYAAAKEDDSENVGNSSRKTIPIRKSQSVSRPLDEGSSVDEFHSADWERSGAEQLYTANALSGSKDDSALVSVRSFRGLRHFKTGRTQPKAKSGSPKARK